MRGEGSVFFDASRQKWIGVLEAGPDPATGRRVRRKVSAPDPVVCQGMLDDLKRGMPPVQSWACLVPACRRRSVTEPPVLLCKEHRDMVVEQARAKPKPAHESLIYFLRNGSRVKIGRTTNLRRRMSQLALPMSAVAATMSGGRDEEVELHYRFAPARVPGTEWFDLTPELENLISSLSCSRAAEKTA
jgi:hypothetical protein